MTTVEITDEEHRELAKALLEALNPLAAAVRSRATGLPEERMWDAEPVEVALSVLSAWKLVDAEVKRLTATAAATAGSYGASYEQLGAAWGITRQGARKKWPEAVSRPAARPDSLELFGGTAELVRDEDSGGWLWTATGADGESGRAVVGHLSREEAAAHAGAFLAGHG
ncbi:hypothetical protein [Kitasatospora cathayae]|uniref:Uncharacterized protein n=1 Tax=Kitasatospora cathayae TaxID=3004092 RepID=A0ABY7QBQ0_9ACTN|nr:hypothetical protein [Kitasatospora sp. HUAS 3-15]WBP90195.1 hypothetical protein O1G21_32955 [Kitasatospora sp. HUAS 3-15]